jgi:hypothetical protein
MGQAPLLVFALHQAAKVEKTLPEGAHIKPDWTGAIRLPKLTHPIPYEHERHPAPIVSLYVVKLTAHAVQERRQVQIIRDETGSGLGVVF